MAREFDSPLTVDDLVYLRSRYAEPYVDRQVALFGLADEDAEDKAAAAEAKAKAKADKEAKAKAEAEAKAQADEEAARAAEEDLIGDSGTGDADGPETASFDVLGSTESEVKEWASSASDEDKASALSAEQARDDRDPRKGVVALLS